MSPSNPLCFGPRPGNQNSRDPGFQLLLRNTLVTNWNERASLILNQNRILKDSLVFSDEMAREMPVDYWKKIKGEPNQTQIGLLCDKAMQLFLSLCK